MTLTIVDRETSVMSLKVTKWHWTMKKHLKKNMLQSYKNILSPISQIQHPQTER